MTTMIALRHLAEVNPSSPEFDALSADAHVLFLPLETVWSDDRADQTRRVPKSKVDSGYSRFHAGDTVCPKVTPTFQAGRAMRARSIGAGTTELHILRPRPGVDPRWLTYAVRSKHFLEEGVTAFQGVAGLQRVPAEFVANFRVVAAPLEEQRRIADFLDDCVARIDKIITAKGRQIDLLHELADRAVEAIAIPNAQPDARRVPTDLPLEGETPADWQVVAIGHLLSRITYGFTNPMPTADDGPLMLTANDIGDGVVRVTSARRTTQEAFDTLLTAKSRPRRGDVLLTKDGTLGRVALFDGQMACVNQSIAVLTPNVNRVRPELLAELLRVPAYRDALVFEAGGTTIKHLYITRVVKQKVAIPRLSDQLSLASSLRAVRSSHSRAVAPIKATVELLHEYKQALITAAVTGELDVTTTGSGIPG